MKLENLKKILRNPKILLYYLEKAHLYRLTDKLYLSVVYELIFNKKLNLENPETFNEKLQWLKLNNRKDIYTTMVDKYEVKEYVSKIIGKEYIIPTLGIYNKFEEIDFTKFPNQFVLKCTHDSGSVIVCKDKKKFNKEEASKKIKKSLKNNYYYQGREWPYKNVKPRIIIEPYLEDKKTKELTDYKIYSFNGECDYVMTCMDRLKGETKFIYFDRMWNLKKELSNHGKKYGDMIKVEKPKNLDKMFEFAKILSKNMPFIRVDFYECNGQLYFGELTFYPSSGFDTKRTKEANEYLTRKLKIGGEI